MPRGPRFALPPQGGFRLDSSSNPARCRGGMRELMDNLLHWQAQHRSGDEIRALFARSRFAGQPLDLSLDDGQVTLTASCRKAA
ncbi:MAG: hypothetical protein JNL30_16865 [Rubrivivax sp.]|nr:hypothetical protein [Rubrivivax sp.]